MKKILLFISVVILVLFIYIKNGDDKVYYLALGDSYSLGMNPYNAYDYGFTDYIKDYLNQSEKLQNFIKDFSVSGYRTIDLLKDIESNKSIVYENQEITIQQALIKADLVTLSIGTNDIIGMASVSPDDSYIDDAMNDMESLLILLRKYCKETIVAVGYFNLINNDYANERYKKLCEKYDIVYIDIYNLINDDYFPNPSNIHPSKKAYELIANKIIEVVDNKF